MNEAPEPLANEPRYAADPDHRLLLELVDPGGNINVSLPVAAPINKNTQATWMVQVRLMHEDGCSKVLHQIPLRPY